MSISNIGLYYYREYFKGIKWRQFDVNASKGQKEGWEKDNIATYRDKNKVLYERKPTQYTTELEKLSIGPQNFPLTTTYPGLLIGSGYNHETGIQEELKLGFFFDHTTGLPVIPGSSVKGLLRSAFGHPAFIKELLENEIEDKYRLSKDELLQIDFKMLMLEIFENKNLHPNETNRSDTLAPYDRDIFYDAYILRSEYVGKENNDSGKIFGNDYITPHKNKNGIRALDPFSNPNPIQFLKILPNVTFCFQFDLKDSKVFKPLTTSIKLNLFNKIICTLGIGAKTNMGYGQFK